MAKDQRRTFGNIHRLPSGRYRVRYTTPSGDRWRHRTRSTRVSTPRRC